MANADPSFDDVGDVCLGVASASSREMAVLVPLLAFKSWQQRAPFNEFQKKESSVISKIHHWLLLNYAHNFIIGASRKTKRHRKIYFMPYKAMIRRNVLCKKGRFLHDNSPQLIIVHYGWERFITS